MKSPKAVPVLANCFRTLFYQAVNYPRRFNYFEFAICSNSLNCEATTNDKL